jgi:hypothetical protein
VRTVEKEVPKAEKKFKTASESHIKFRVARLLIVGAVVSKVVLRRRIGGIADVINV